jgi:hypothetical protein
MDVESVEQYIMGLPLRELAFRTESEVYVLGNFYTKPAWWHVRHAVVGLACEGGYEVRGLKNAVAFIEHRYPDFYAWLVCTFHEEGVIG